MPRLNDDKIFGDIELKDITQPKPNSSPDSFVKVSLIFQASQVNKEQLFGSGQLYELMDQVSINSRDSIEIWDEERKVKEEKVTTYFETLSYKTHESSDLRTAWLKYINSPVSQYKKFYATDYEKFLESDSELKKILNEFNQHFDQPESDKKRAQVQQEEEENRLRLNEDLEQHGDAFIRQTETFRR